MIVEAAFLHVFYASLTGLVLSVVIEQFLSPRPPLARPFQAWLIHIGLWFVCHSLATLLLGRPWFAAAIVLAVFLTLVLVNNAKVKVLREPFVYQDYEYFIDMLKHPRLYIPFMGWGKFLGATAGFLLALFIGLWGETPPVLRFSIYGQLGGVGFLLGTGFILLFLGNRSPIVVTFAPERDLLEYGLLASLKQYRKEEEIIPLVQSPYNKITQHPRPAELPQLVAVQSESFFDPRSLYSGIKSEVLKDFDKLKMEATQCGKLSVPCWGANTVRSEFAFLSGIEAGRIGVHRFNPYRPIVAGWEVGSLALYLKSFGYRTVCVHPYPMSFYRRDVVSPRLGFDEFHDIRRFEGAEHFGPYVSDVAVAEKIRGMLQEATSPLFIFAITMENHGPLHLEKVTPADIEELYSIAPPIGCDDLTIYLRHLRNADRMISLLRGAFMQCEGPASLCWFGDHVPIMPAVYKNLGEPGGEVDYCIWHNKKMGSGQNVKTSVESLSIDWLHQIGLY